MVSEQIMPMIETHSGMMPMQTTQSTPWAIIALCAGLLGLASGGGYLLGGLTARVTTVETRVGDNASEFRSAIAKIQSAYLINTQAYNDLKFTLGQLQIQQGNIARDVNTLLKRQGAEPTP